MEARVGIAQLSCPAHVDRDEGRGVRDREKGKLRLRRKGWAARKWVDTSGEWWSKRRTVSDTRV